MDARYGRQTAFWALFLGLALLANPSSGAGFRTANFVVSAPTAALAQEIGESAEAWRERLALEWVGKPMPNWNKPCPIRAQVAPTLGAGGATTFVFNQGEVYDWQMSVQGSRERVLDSVLPHEITHTIFASHFRRPLPRWADEGACTTVEHQSEIGKQERLLIQFLKTGKGIPFTQLFAMKEYPADILPLYAQGHSLTQFLIEQHGKESFMNFLGDGMGHENWRRAVAEHYGHENLYALQEDWLGWVRQGRPRLDLDPSQVARNEPTIVRGQGSGTQVATSTGPLPGGSPSVYRLRRPRSDEPLRDASCQPKTLWR